MSEVNYGPPLRFKAVEKLTGEDAFQTWIKGEPKPFPAFDDDPILSIGGCERWALYQSTGFKDKNGKEVFFGDVVVFGGDVYRVITNPSTQSPGIHTFLDGDPKTKIEGGIHTLIKSCVIIGNIHMPESVLRDRANGY